MLKYMETEEWIAPGVYGITGEMLKAGSEIVVQWLHKIVDLAWMSGNVPMDRQKAVIIPIHTKRSKTPMQGLPYH